LNAREFLSRLNHVKPSGTGWQAKCPAHDDGTASLSVSEASDGKILMHCHAGCAPEAICSKLGLTLADLFTDTANGNGGKPSIVATYDYADERGTLLFQVCRMWPKDFRQRQPDGNGAWTWNTKGVRRVLYRLPETLAAVQRAETVYVVEGEKDVAALVANGFAATCNAGGAGKWRSEYNATLSARARINSGSAWERGCNSIRAARSA